MLADLLPVPLKSAKVELSIPAGWQVSTAEARNAAGAFEVADAERAVFAVGRDLKERRGRAGSLSFTLVTAGDWAFTEEEAADSAAEILKIHQEMAGGSPRRSPTVVLLPLPQTGAAREPLERGDAGARRSCSSRGVCPQNSPPKRSSTAR